MSARFIVGDVFDGLASLPDHSVDCVVTSPPFLALRSYLPPDHPDKGKEIGAEPTPAAFLDTLLELTAELRRVVAPHGSIFVELGDTYSGSGGAGGDYADGGLRDGQQAFSGSASRSGWHRMGKRAEQSDQPSNYRKAGTVSTSGTRNGGSGWPLAKSLCFIPELYGASLSYGRNLLSGEASPAGSWLVRNKVAWVRPNPPVGALGDKVRPGWSMGVWACTSPRRWFDLDAVRTEHKSDPDKYTGNGYTKGNPAGDGDTVMKGNPAGAPPLDWWKIPPGGYQGSHYAVFPPELCRIPIEASCPRRVCRTCGEPSRREVEHDEATMKANALKRGPVSCDDRSGQGDGFYQKAHYESRNVTTTGWSSCGCPGADGIRLDGYHTGTGWRPGVVLDPFAGSGTTLMVATSRSREAIGLDLDERNADLALDRVGPMFLTVEHLSDEGAA